MSLSFPSVSVATSSMQRRAAFTVLLVDDDPLVLKVTKAMLGHAGFAVVACDCGASALGVASVRPSVSALLTDFQMPGMTGFELAEQMVRRQPGLPVLMMSGTAPEDLPLKAMHAARWSYMPKPLDRERLLRLLDGMCGL